MVVTGPSLNNPARSFYNEGHARGPRSACAHDGAGNRPQMCELRPYGDASDRARMRSRRGDQCSFVAASARRRTRRDGAGSCRHDASVIEGTTQQIEVNTNPPGADCGLYREEAMRICRHPEDARQALIQKTKNDIWIVCVKPGYQQATYLNHSGVAGAAFVNVIGGVFTLGISTAIGAAGPNGADNETTAPSTWRWSPTRRVWPKGRPCCRKATRAPKPARNGQQAPLPAVRRQLRHVRSRCVLDGCPGGAISATLAHSCVAALDIMPAG